MSDVLAVLYLLNPIAFLLSPLIAFLVVLALIGTAEYDDSGAVIGFRAGLISVLWRYIKRRRG